MAWRVGLLGGSRADRVDRVDRADETGDAVDCFEERVPRFVGEDISWMFEDWGEGGMGSVLESSRSKEGEQKLLPQRETRLALSGFLFGAACRGRQHVICLWLERLPQDEMT